MDKSLNKYISETGFCSRREADNYIDQGRVTINDNVAIKGNRVKPGDIVEIDGEPIKKKDKTVYIAFNKPVGITCTTDLKDKSNIISFINHKSRIFPIGRLDKPSEGLIFLTNDGDIVNKILRAGNNHEKEYVVTVDKPITGDFIHKMSNGVKILDTVTKKCFVKQEGKNRFRIILTQGLNRQIRRMCAALGYGVDTLRRTRIMHITLSNLPAGKWRYFTPDEIKLMEISLARSIKTANSSLSDETNWNE
jgi:23S rRNA pseudouridine2604 synthase